MDGMQCGAPLYFFSTACLSSFDDRMAAAPTGTICLSSPCNITVGHVTHVQEDANRFCDNSVDGGEIPSEIMAKPVPRLQILRRRHTRPTSVRGICRNQQPDRQVQRRSRRRHHNRRPGQWVAYDEQLRWQHRQSDLSGLATVIDACKDLHPTGGQRPFEDGQCVLRTNVHSRASQCRGQNSSLPLHSTPISLSLRHTPGQRRMPPSAAQSHSVISMKPAWAS